MKPMIPMSRRSGRCALIFVTGLLMVPFCFLFSTVPAVLLSSAAPGARPLPYLGGGDLVWVAPWLYYFSSLFYYLTFASLGIAALGVLWFVWRTSQRLHPETVTNADSGL